MIKRFRLLAWDKPSPRAEKASFENLIPIKWRVFRHLESCMFWEKALTSCKVSCVFYDNFFVSSSDCLCWEKVIRAFFLSSCCRLQTSEKNWIVLSDLKSWIMVIRAFASSLWTTSMFRDISVPFFRLVSDRKRGQSLLLGTKVFVTRLKNSVLSKMLHCKVLDLILNDLEVILW